jgi:hypothetical protein
MASSPAFAAPGHADALLWGIDAQSRLYAVDPKTVAPEYLEELNPSFSSPDQLRQLGTINASVSAFLSSLIRGYGSRCAGAENIRASAPRP